jgi:hypothetical protein
MLDGAGRSICGLFRSKADVDSFSSPFAEVHLVIRCANRHRRSGGVGLVESLQSAPAHASAMGSIVRSVEDAWRDDLAARDDDDADACIVYVYNRSVYISSRQCKRQGYTTLPRTLTLSP